MPKQGMDIAQQSRHRIGLDGFRLIRWRKARRLGATTKWSRLNFHELAHVQRPAVLAAVKEQHELALAALGNVEPHAVAVASPCTRPDWLAPVRGQMAAEARVANDSLAPNVSQVSFG